MKKGDLILVYGTLRRGERADLSKHQWQFGAQFIGLDAINGDLYHLGSYPGVKVPGEPHIWDPRLPIVCGEVFRVRDQSLVAMLDAYEGYPHLYDRVETETESGRRVWVYTYNGMVTSEQRIPSGDWCKNRDTVIQERRLGT